jgi:type II secretory pathway pseudopilin PulG
MQPGDWIALAALVIAILVGVAQYRLQKATARTQNQLQERLAAIEEQKRSEELASRSAALIVCEKRQDATSSGRLATWIVFRNDGQAVALDVWFEREPLAPLITSDEESHYPGLAPGQEWKILADPNMGDPERIIFRYGWTDDFGQHDEEMVYSVFT